MHRARSLAAVTALATLTFAALAALATIAACPPAGDGAAEGEGEGEGDADDNGLLCNPPCSGGDACAQDNCGFVFCQPVVTEEGGACDADSVACDEGGSHPCAAGFECTGVPGALTCAAAGEAGAPCDVAAVGASRDGCAAGFVCMPEQAVCAPACAANGTCPGTDECVAGGCFPVAGEGGACPVEATIEIDNRADGCADDVRCGFDGDPAAGATPQCIRDECVTDADCAGGTCHQPGCFLGKRTCVALVGAGGNCFADCSGDGCSNFAETCAAGLECRHDFDTCPGGGGVIGTCVVPSPKGGSCSPTGDQETDGCVAGEACDKVADACL